MSEEAAVEALAGLLHQKNQHRTFDDDGSVQEEEGDKTGAGVLPRSTRRRVPKVRDMIAKSLSPIAHQERKQRSQPKKDHA